MLRPPYTGYDRLYVYYLDRCDLQPVLDPDLIGIWIEDDHAILFFHRPKEELIASVCERENTSLIYQADLNYRDWEAGVSITAFTTKYLHVHPVWEKKEQSEDEKNRIGIELDPSVIFGSGFHPSTRLCLETLELLICQSGARIDSVLDLGTGTGLLSIAAAKLGVEKVTAIDNNPLAVAVARGNVKRNDCETQIRVEQVDLFSGLPSTSCDVIIANLYKGLLVRLFENPDFWHGKMYLLSGFMPEMEGDLLAALDDRRIQMLHRANSGPWRLWLIRNQDTGV